MGRKLFMLVLSLAVIFSFTMGVCAASLSIEAPADEVKEGESFTVNITYQDIRIDNVKGCIKYDDEALECIAGGSSSGSAGVAELNGYSEDAETIQFEIEFKALKSGATTLKIQTDECYNLDGEQLNSPWENVKVVVSEGTVSDEPQEKTEEAASEPEETEAQEADDQDTDDQIKNNTIVLEIAIGITAALILIIALIKLIRRRK